MLKRLPKPQRTLFGLLSFASFRIARVHNQLNSQAISILSKHSELTLTEWRIISTIEMEKCATASAIVSLTLMDKGQISRSIKSLKQRGLILIDGEREDQRQQPLRLSATGKQQFNQVVELMRKRQQNLTREISDAELAVFLSVLDRMEARARDTII